MPNLAVPLRYRAPGWRSARPSIAASAAIRWVWGRYSWSPSTMNSSRHRSCAGSLARAIPARATSTSACWTWKIPSAARWPSMAFAWPSARRSTMASTTPPPIQARSICSPSPTPRSARLCSKRAWARAIPGSRTSMLPALKPATSSDRASPFVATSLPSARRRTMASTTSPVIPARPISSPSPRRFSTTARSRASAASDIRAARISRWPGLPRETFSAALWPSPIQARGWRSAPLRTMATATAMAIPAQSICSTLPTRFSPVHCIWPRSAPDTAAPTTFPSRRWESTPISERLWPCPAASWWSERQAISACPAGASMWGGPISSPSPPPTWMAQAFRGGLPPGRSMPATC